MKRIISLALTLVLCLSLLALPAQSAGDADSVFSSQLTELSRQIYEGLTTPEAMQAYRTGDSIKFSFEGSFYDMADALLEAIGPAFAAVMMEHTEIFWVSSYTVSAGGRNAVSLSVTPVFWETWGAGGRSIAEDEAVLHAAVEKLAAEAAAQGGVYEQLLYVHDWLTTHNVYNFPAADYDVDEMEANCLPWTPLSALTDLDKPVCEGYASAFKLVCDELGIPCIKVCGEAWGPHAWNQVQLDGKWYAVDVTFDDPTMGDDTKVISGIEAHDYFLIGADSCPPYMPPFSETHIPDAVSDFGAEFDYPPLSSQAYDPGEGATLPGPAPEQPSKPAPGPQPGLANFQKTKEYTDGMFTDVAASAWYAENVRTAYELGLMVGSGGGFHPSGNLTVTEALVLACRLHSIYYADGESFVQGTPWYLVYMDYADRHDISLPSGCDLNAPATRLEFAEILSAALPEEALQKINSVPDGSIPDVADDPAVYRLYRAGILTGSDESGAFEPDKSIQRSAVAAIVTRMAVPELRRQISPLPATPEETPPETVFDFIVSYLAETGEEMADGHYCRLREDDAYFITLGYERTDDLLSLNCAYSDEESGLTAFSSLEIDRAMSQPYGGAIMIFPGTDDEESVALASIDAAEFSFDPKDPVPFDLCWGMDEKSAATFESLFTADICVALEDLQTNILGPGGHSLAELGFARYAG
jgi:hypothetical protein